MTIKYILFTDVIQIHERLAEIDEAPLEGGILNGGMIQASVSKPEMVIFGEELHKTIEEKAAILILELCRTHGFVDGNKRTAIASGEYFLFINNCKLISNREQKFNMMMDCAQNNTEFDEMYEKLINWIKGDIRTIE